VRIEFRDSFQDRVMGTQSYSNTVRIGYARTSTRLQDHQLQLDALAAACREVIVETASTERPKLRATLTTLKPGDTLVIYKPDRIARSMKELLVLLEDELHAREVNLHILTGICAGIHRRNAASIADKMLFMVAAMAAEMERDLIRERTLDGLAAAQAQGRKGGRPPAVDHDTLAIAIARRARGESVNAIARHLQIGRSTLYRALEPYEAQAPKPVVARPGRPVSAGQANPLEISPLLPEPSPGYSTRCATWPPVSYPDAITCQGRRLVQHRQTGERTVRIHMRPEERIERAAVLGGELVRPLRIVPILGQVFLRVTPPARTLHPDLPAT
jgi:DNA invertase Pin-like site-specific DNA recombinase